MPKAIWVAVGHIDTILTLAYEHDSATFSVSGTRDPLADFLQAAPTSLLNLEVSPPFSHSTEDTFLDDSAGVHFGKIDIGAVVHGVDCTKVCWHDFIVSVGLEVVQVGLVMDLANHVEILVGPLAGVGGSRLNRCRHLLLRWGVLCIQVLSGQIGTNGSFEMTGASLLTRLRQGWCLVMGTQIDYALEYLNLIGINVWGLRFHQGLSPHRLHCPLPILRLGLCPVASTWGPCLPMVVHRENCWVAPFSHLTEEMPSVCRGVEENASEWPERPHPWPEGAGVLDSNLQIPQLMGSSSSSSSDETSWKVAENDSAEWRSLREHYGAIIGESLHYGLNYTGHATPVWVFRP